VSETDERLEKYAALVVEAGLGLRKGQTLLVNTEVANAPLAEAIAAHGYRAGAGYVDVLYSDAHVRRALVADGPDEAIGATPPWMVRRIEDAIAEGAAIANIAGASNAALFTGLDPTKLGRARHLAIDRIWMEAVNERSVAWTIVAYPTEEWAIEALGEPDVERLWDAVAHTLRFDAPDPAAAWQARADELGERAHQLSERGFDALRYRGPGTDLEVGLIAGARWLAGREETVDGQQHIANLPTEEVFTSPDRNRAEGTIRSTKPLAMRGGGVVEGLEVTFRRGKIVEVRADQGAELVETELAIDDGAPQLGELALVDTSSRVADTEIIFQNTLFDENATSHIAWGAGFTWAIEHLPEADGAGALINESQVHTDFMVGGPEVEIDAVEPGGAVVPLLYGGEWRI
jgi:aminopeptidase